MSEKNADHNGDDDLQVERFVEWLVCGFDSHPPYFHCAPVDDCVASAGVWDAAQQGCASGTVASVRRRT